MVLGPIRFSLQSNLSKKNGLPLIEQFSSNRDHICIICFKTFYLPHVHSQFKIAISPNTNVFGLPTQNTPLRVRTKNHLAVRQ